MTENDWLRSRIDDVLTCLYDYEYIDLEKFYNDKGNLTLLLQFDEGNDSILNDLYNEISNFIEFETNYNSKISDF